MEVSVCTATCLALSGLFLLRLLWTFACTWVGDAALGKKKRKLGETVRTLVVIGSGGHTAEMLRLMSAVNPCSYSPRLYLLADTDMSSRIRVECLESNWSSMYGPKCGSYQTHQIPRSRHVGQSYLTAVYSTLISLRHSWPVLRSFNPDLVLANGPGTCVPICFLAFLARFAGIGKGAKVIFVESICRVTSLSLSGWILLPFANYILVQWPMLKWLPRVKYMGRLT